MHHYVQDLSLADKSKVISEYEKSVISYRRLADEYGVGKTQIQQTIKRTAEYMTAYEDNACSSHKIPESGQIPNKDTWQ